MNVNRLKKRAFDVFKEWRFGPWKRSISQMKRIKSKGEIVVFLQLIGHRVRKLHSLHIRKLKAIVHMNKNADWLTHIDSISCL